MLFEQWGLLRHTQADGKWESCRLIIISGILFNYRRFCYLYITPLIIFFWNLSLNYKFLSVVLLQQREQLERLKNDQIHQAEFHAQQIKEHEEAIQRHKDFLDNLHK